MNVFLAGAQEIEEVHAHVFAGLADALYFILHTPNNSLVGVFRPKKLFEASRQRVLSPGKE
jgi:hypothetical protein